MEDNTSPKKRGRKSSGMPAKDVMRIASKNRRERLLGEGRAELKTFVDPKTKQGLDVLKKTMEVKMVGDVIDLLVTQEMKRRKLILDTLN